MNFQRRRLIPANQAEILRSHQRDKQFVRVLKDHFEEIMINARLRKYSNFVSSETAMELLYFVLTHGIGNQTLGEEYTGIVPVKLKTTSIQPLNIRILVTLTECFGQTFLSNLIDRSIRWLFGPHCKFRPEAVEKLSNALQRFKAVIPLLILFHQGIFYFTGRYSTIGKRLFRIDYAKVYGRRATHSVNWGIKLLGLIMLAQCALRLWQVEPCATDSNSENIVPLNKDALKCNLCLERKSTTTTVCGHLFCWFCIVEWLQGQHYCPLCREPMPPSRIVYLMNL